LGFGDAIFQEKSMGRRETREESKFMCLSAKLIKFRIQIMEETEKILTICLPKLSPLFAVLVI
jgi:hypothetical protein